MNTPNRRGPQRAEILFTFETSRPKPMQYRAVQGIDGGFRMERKGPEAKRFRTYMWTGSEECLFPSYFLATFERGLVGEVPAYVQKWVDAGQLPWWIENRIEEYRKKGLCR